MATKATTTTKRSRPIRDALGETAQTIGTTARAIRRGVTIIDLTLQETELEAHVDLLQYKAEVASTIGLKYDTKAELAEVLNKIK